MLQLLWFIPLLPFAGFLLNGLLGARHLPRRTVGLLACATVLGSLLLSFGAVAELHGLGGWGRDLPERAAKAGVTIDVETFGGLPSARVDLANERATLDLFEWMPLGEGEDGSEWTVRWAYALDPLSAVML